MGPKILITPWSITRSRGRVKKPRFKRINVHSVKTIYIVPPKTDLVVEEIATENLQMVASSDAWAMHSAFRTKFLCPIPYKDVKEWQGPKIYRSFAGCALMPPGPFQPSFAQGWTGLPDELKLKIISYAVCRKWQHVRYMEHASAVEIQTPKDIQTSEETWSFNNVLPLLLVGTSSCTGPNQAYVREVKRISTLALQCYYGENTFATSRLSLPEILDRTCTLAPRILQLVRKIEVTAIITTGHVLWLANLATWLRGCDPALHLNICIKWNPIIEGFGHLHVYTTDEHARRLKLAVQTVITEVQSIMKTEKVEFPFRGQVRHHLETEFHASGFGVPRAGGRVRGDEALHSLVAERAELEKELTGFFLFVPPDKE